MGLINGDDAMVMIEDAAEELSTTVLRLLMLLREGTLAAEKITESG